jgi:mono/diheme cytochrome c family protein
MNVIEPRRFSINATLGSSPQPPGAFLLFPLPESVALDHRWRVPYAVRQISSAVRLLFFPVFLPISITVTIGPLVAQGKPGARTLTPFERQKAESLLRTRYPCLGCHELNGTGGRIGPSFTGLGARRPAEYVYAMIRDPQHTVSGTVMPRVEMPAKTLELIAAFLLEQKSAPSGTDTARIASAPPASNTDGKALYGRYCASCHGTEGGGNGPNARYLAVQPTAHSSASLMSKRSDDALFDTIFAGGYIMNRSNLMPPFGATLSAPDIRTLVSYIRTLCHCQGPPWSQNPAAK